MLQHGDIILMLDLVLYLHGFKEEPRPIKKHEICYLCKYKKTVLFQHFNSSLVFEPLAEIHEISLLVAWNISKLSIVQENISSL